MATIWKFPLVITDEQDTFVPVGAEVLHVGLDPQGQPCLWMRVDEYALMEQRTFYVVGTGNPMPGGVRTHLGSFTSGPFVWHVFS